MGAVSLGSPDFILSKSRRMTSLLIPSVSLARTWFCRIRSKFELWGFSLMSTSV